MREHWHMTGGNSDRSSLHRSRFGLLKLWSNGAVVARNYKPRRFGLPGGGRDCGLENSCRRGTLCRRQYLLLIVWEILGEVFGDSLCGHGQKTTSICPDFAEQWGRRKRLGCRGYGLAFRRRERSHIDQPDYLWIVSRLRDYRSTIGMAYQQYRALLQRDGALGGGNIV